MWFTVCISLHEQYVISLCQITMSILFATFDHALFNTLSVDFSLSLSFSSYTMCVYLFLSNLYL